MTKRNLAMSLLDSRVKKEGGSEGVISFRKELEELSEFIESETRVSFYDNSKILYAVRELLFEVDCDAFKAGRKEGLKAKEKKEGE